MFLLNHKVEMVVLISVIGILLPQVFIQTAQGFFGGGLQCYSCENCDNNTIGFIRRCQLMDKYCVWGEREHADATRIPFRGCAGVMLVEKSGFNCDIFKSERKSSFLPRSYYSGDKMRMCNCVGNLCNKNDTSPPPEGQASGRNAFIAENATSSFTSPQPLIVSVSVCVSGFLVPK